VWINKHEMKELSKDIRKIIDGQDIDLRVNDEGTWNILRNDIHTLAQLRHEQVNALQRDKEVLKDTLADISHQLKTPLTSMTIMAELLENAPPEKQAEFVSHIKAGLARTDWLVTALLKMAKLDAGAVNFVCEAVYFDELATLALAPLQIQLELKKQSIVTTGKTLLHCDKRWTAEALTNIIKNASEHAPPNSKIAIEAGQNPICTWLSITDEGPGLSHEQRAKLFRRFESSHNSAGFGIGLPLALAIMRGQGGDIAVANGEQTGAVFIMKFFQ